jgi:hypothetical protein
MEAPTATRPHRNNALHRNQRGTVCFCKRHKRFLNCSFQMCTKAQAHMLLSCTPLAVRMSFLAEVAGKITCLCVYFILCAYFERWETAQFMPIRRHCLVTRLKSSCEWQESWRDKFATVKSPSYCSCRILR